MPLDLKTFYTRTISSVFFVAIMLAGLLWNVWAFLALLCLINVLCLHEYFGLMKKITPDIHRRQWQYISIQILGLFIIIGQFIYTLIKDLSGGKDTPLVFLLVLAVTPACMFLFSLLSKKDSFFSMLQGIGGLAYITLPMVMLEYMYYFSSLLPLTLIVLIWVNDTMAYLSGSFIGKTPLTPISPKKTWEGTIGGILLTMVAGIIYSHFSKMFTMVDAIVLALCASVAGTLGDLMKSKLKRLAGVKDSGNIIPGHGGALDRFDSLLVATPFAYVYCMVFMHHTLSL